ncbi:MAG: AAA family ATPase [Chloroflexi bacterium]|nr:AAA family ATPase [Chloroflexota bacterium]
MSTRLADRLSAARRRRFVGRTGELALFQSALTTPEPPFCVLHVFGPGGVGKTTLLREFTALSQQAEIPAHYIDARNVEPSPESFVDALRLAMGLGPRESPLQALAAPQRRVVLVDTYETFAPLDGWLREVFLPQLPEHVLVALASRNPPSPAWRADPGWQHLIRAMPLRNLSPEESRTFLIKREIPLEQHQAVLDFTRGHPLALSLVADLFDQRRSIQFEPEAAPDVVRTLLEQLVQKVPGPAHRAALEACALVRVATEPLLADLLGTPDAHDLFDWLRGLSFMESGRLGVFPHDLAREALAADLRWRNPDWYAELHRRARTYYAARFQQTDGREQERLLFDYVFLHRDNAVVRPFFDLLEGQDGGGLLTDAAREADVPALVAMVAQHEGEASARLAAHWLARQRHRVLVLRDAEQQPAGFVAMVNLQEADAADLDPAARAARQYLARHAPLRPHETATLFRFWMARSTYQAVSPCQSVIFVNMVRHYLTTPGLAFTFLPCADPDFFAPVFAYADLARLPEADFEVGGRRHGVYGHDWRVIPPLAWLALLAERETAASPQAASAPQTAEPMLVLSQSDFAAAVRDALRDFCQADALRANPLLRSRLVLERAGASGGAAERVAALQAVVKDAVESLQASPREAKWYRALHHTYLRPAPTQEAAAELLDLPFSTFRRHLTAGITRVAELLWQRELHGAAASRQ